MSFESYSERFVQLRQKWRKIYPEIPPYDRLLLSPWRKWKKYNRFPWKVMLHTMIFISVVVYIGYLYETVSKYSRANISMFSSQIVEDSDAQTLELYSVVDFQLLFKRTVDAFFDEDDSLDTFVPLSLDGSEPSIRLTFNSYRTPLIVPTGPGSWEVGSDDVSSDQYDLVASARYGPFNMTDLEMLTDTLQRMNSMQLEYSVQNADHGVFGVVPMRWHIVVGMSRIAGRIDVSLEAHIEDTDSPVPFLVTSLLLEVFIIALACVSSFLAAKSVFEKAILYFKVRRLYRSIPESVRATEEYPLWSQYPWSMLVGFVDGWELFHVISCVLLIVGVGLNALSRLEMIGHVPTMMILAFASAGICLNILKYFEYLKQFYVLLSTLRIASGHVVRYLITALPIFFAYVIMGVLLFSPYSSRFESIIGTAVTLFSLINGDEIHATFDNLLSAYPYQILVEVYLFSFVALFITSILPVFLFIIEDSYHNAKDKGHSPDDVFSAAAYAHLSAADAVYPWKNLEILDLRIMFHVLKREFGHRWEPAEQRPPAAAASPVPLVANDATALPPSQDNSSSEVELSERTPLVSSIAGAATATAGSYVAGAMGGGVTSPEIADLVQVEMSKLRTDLSQKAALLLTDYFTRQQESMSAMRTAFEQQMREMIERETAEVVRNLT
jgi:uncharacterized membrane protein (Fun14 family)